MLKYDLNRYRKLFPVVQAGTIYLNHAATGPLSTRIVTAVRGYLQERHETHIDNYELFQPILMETRFYASSLLNTSPRSLSGNIHIGGVQFSKL